MMINLTKKKAIIFSLALIMFLAILFILLSRGGVVRRHSNIRMGYVENTTSNSWEAHYASLQGNSSTVLNVKSGILDVSITTESGSISIEITDMDGNNLYRGNNLETCSFSVGANGKVKISIDAEKHSGSFSFKQGR